ncbi:facilitated trehalose transporter Tret1-like [Cylas formicarius]|uniref:facilitated trehalose transporter Tret1-like n=1 Tax=Cylas formicarius TaxID=197179 RepID=UPI0029589C2F|nr:facilitated trehalose transporter Tret1-like [Cylas formicarius]XP_060530447.1 facilitated trehalose transporter Tret1-like [Cylas formicarius]
MLNPSEKASPELQNQDDRSSNGHLGFEKGKEKIKEWPQIIAIIIGGLGAFTNGMLFVWTSPFTVKIVNDTEHYQISEEEASEFTIFPPIGLIASSFFFFKLVDVIGRKRTVLLLAVPHLTFWTTIIFAKSVYVFYAARFVAGIGDATLFASLPIYCGEISTPKVRGTWGNSVAFFLYGGQFFINCIGSYLDVRQTAYVCIGFPVIFIILLSLMPESPYFFIRKGNYEAAKSTMKWLRRSENIDDEFGKMKTEVERQISESGSWKDLITIPSNRNALIAGVFLRFSQQFCGITIFSTYSQAIFEKAGGSVSASTSAMIFSGLCWGLNFCLFGAVEKFGRRMTYMYSLLSSAVVLFVVSAYLFIEQHDFFDVSAVKWLPLAGMIVYIFCYSFGLGVVPIIMLGELFSASIKAKALCVLNIVFGLGIFITTYLFHILNNNVGLYCPFVVFSIACFISSALTTYFVPETKGKTLDEINQMLKGRSFNANK